jgi:hypothetical protein
VSAEQRLTAKEDPCTQPFPGGKYLLGSDIQQTAGGKCLLSIDTQQSAGGKCLLSSDT